MAAIAASLAVDFQREIAVVDRDALPPHNRGTLTHLDLWAGFLP